MSMQSSKSLLRSTKHPKKRSIVCFKKKKNLPTLNQISSFFFFMDVHHPTPQHTGVSCCCFVRFTPTKFPIFFRLPIFFQVSIFSKSPTLGKGEGIPFFSLLSFSTLSITPSHSNTHTHTHRPWSVVKLNTPPTFYFVFVFVLFCFVLFFACLLCSLSLLFLLPFPFLTRWPILVVREFEEHPFLLGFGL